MEELLDDSEVLMVNLAEVARKLFAKRVAGEEVFEILDGLRLEPDGEEFGPPWPGERPQSSSGLHQAMYVRAVAAANRKTGLSLGDAVCLTMAALYGRKVVTADRAWSQCVWPDLEGFAKRPEVIVIR